MLPQQERNARILVMDDEEPILRVVTNILEKVGYAVACTNDGEEAILEYERALQDGCPFDAVIMDLTIPGGMGGKETVQRLLELDPNVRAIVASGYSNDPIMARAGDFGFCAEIAKPFGAAELTRTLGQVLAQRRPLEEQAPLIHEDERI